LQLRPTSAIGGRRPVSRYSRQASRAGHSPRHKSENVLMIELDMPSRTTRAYEPPSMAPQLVAALETALQDEGDIELDGRYHFWQFSLNSLRCYGLAHLSLILVLC